MKNDDIAHCLDIMSDILGYESRPNFYLEAYKALVRNYEKTGAKHPETIAIKFLITTFCDLNGEGFKE